MSREDNKSDVILDMGVLDDAEPIDFIAKYKGKPIEYSQKVKEALASVFKLEIPKTLAQQNPVIVEFPKPVAQKIRARMEVEKVQLQRVRVTAEIIEEKVQVAPRIVPEIPPPPPPFTPPNFVVSEPKMPGKKSSLDELKKKTVTENPSAQAVKKTRRASPLSKFNQTRDKNQGDGKGSESYLPRKSAPTSVTPLNSQSFMNSIVDRGKQLRSPEDSDDEEERNGNTY